MRVDVKETAQGYEVHAELPGMKGDIHVHIDVPVVLISAERKQEKEIKDGEKVLRTERYFGKVSRSFQLGQEIDEGAASAKFNDGVLELKLPKKAEVQARRTHHRVSAAAGPRRNGSRLAALLHGGAALGGP